MGFPIVTGQLMLGQIWAIQLGSVSGKIWRNVYAAKRRRRRTRPAYSRRHTPVARLPREGSDSRCRSPARNYRIVLFAVAGLLRERARSYRASPTDHQSRLFAAENRQSAAFFPGRRRRRRLSALGFPLWRIVFRVANGTLGPG